MKKTFVFIDAQNLNLAISGDGDFLELYDYINEKKKLYRIIVPNSYRFSKLLGKYRSKISYLNYDIKDIIVDNKKLARFAGRDVPLGLSGHRDDNKSIAQPSKKVNKKGKI